jgi:uncharacterized protein (DUF2141 family)
MLKSRSRIIAVVAALGAAIAAAPALAQDILGPEAAACRAGDGPAALVRVHGFKDRTGKLRVQLYGGDPEAFLEKGQKLKRIEVPVTPAGDMHVCVKLPASGRYALAILHDRNANGKMNPTNDGVGFSRNPKLGLSKPDFEKVVFAANGSVQAHDVVLNYMRGLSVRPIAARS